MVHSSLASSSLLRFLCLFRFSPPLPLLSSASVLSVSSGSLLVFRFSHLFRFSPSLLSVPCFPVSSHSQSVRLISFFAQKFISFPPSNISFFSPTSKPSTFFRRNVLVLFICYLLVTQRAPSIIYE